MYRSRIPSRSARLLAPLVLALACPTWSQEPAESGKQQRPAAYDEKADAKADIEAALVKAGHENQRVLLVFGGNWCDWCVKFNDLTVKNAKVSRALLYEYRVVRVDVGKLDKNMPLAERFGAKLATTGVPHLTVLAATGKTLAHQETGALVVGDKHDPVKVLEFLDKWKAEPQDAHAIMAAAKAKAAKDQKKVLVHLGAPW